MASAPTMPTVREHDQSSQSITTATGKEVEDTLADFGHIERPNTATESQLSNRGAAKWRSRMGLPEAAPIDEEHRELHHHNYWWSGLRLALREPFAEFFGTFIMILFGDGSVAQVILSAGSGPGGNGNGNYQSINWCWGIGVMLGIYTAGDSGGFLNPAVMFSFCLYRRLPWARFPVYLIAQFLGGFVGSGVVYGVYFEAIDNFEGVGIRTVGEKTSTAGIFCTYPAPFLSKTGQFFSEFVSSMILMFVIFALKDSTNPGAMGKSGSGPLFPIALLFLIFGIGAAFGFQTGYAINLARDLGPRLMSYIVGYGPGVWSAGDYYFWVPCVASFIGCAFGGFLYDAFIYTGEESPLNTSWMGLRRLFQPDWEDQMKRHHSRRRLA